MPKVSEDVMAVLSQAQINGSRVELVGKLDRKLYTKTDEVLQAAGGKWNKHARAHVFEGSAIDAIDPILLTGEYSRTKQDFGQFDTPTDLAQRLVAMADLGPGMRCLEPSAGIGRIAIEAAKTGAEVTCVEIDPKRFDTLCAAGLPTVICADFTQILTARDLPAQDAVVMNPPFARQADIDHVGHAYKFLKRGGRLVAVMSAGVTFREDIKTRAFRQFVADCGGTVEKLPSGSFKSSGTMVEACVVKIIA